MSENNQIGDEMKEIRIDGVIIRTNGTNFTIEGGQQSTVNNVQKKECSESKKQEICRLLFLTLFGIIITPPFLYFLKFWYGDYDTSILGFINFFTTLLLLYNIRSSLSRISMIFWILLLIINTQCALFLFIIPILKNLFS